MNEPIETIHVYIVREEEDDQPVVDSTAHDTTKIDTQPLVQKSQRRYSLLVPSLIVAANLSVVLAVFFIHIYPILTATATITIIPKSYRLTEQLTLSTVQSRVFQPVTLTQSRTVPATGKGHQPATQAHGAVTFYNTLPQEQTILAGTLLTASNGEQFLTDNDIAIPAGTYAVNGQATVSATAQNYGQEGNIAAGAIHGLCCRAGILILSSAFSGGADSRDYMMVTKLDINSVVSSVMPILTQQINVAFHQQIRAGELLTPNQCSQTIAPDRNVGDEATYVTVMVSESCTGAAYNQHSLQLQMTHAFLQHTFARTGNGYVLHSLHSTITNVLLKDGSLHLSVLCQGDLIYHLSSQELQQLRGELAGKTRQQAVAILSHLNGVEHVLLQLKGTNEKLPMNAANITFLFVVDNQ